MWRKWRFRFVLFFVKIWFLNACARLKRPEPLRLKRFAAPLLVFNFGIFSTPSKNLYSLLIGERFRPNHRVRRFDRG